MFHRVVSTLTPLTLRRLFMALFNPPDHLSCHHYATHANSGWLLVDRSTQRSYQGISEYHSILFCTRGSVRIAAGGGALEASKGTDEVYPSWHLGEGNHECRWRADERIL